jgi:hypothetical protein
MNASHQSITSYMDELTERYSNAGEQTSSQERIVHDLEVKLENERRELTRLEANEAELVHELDYAWNALAEFEALELDRQHEDAQAHIEYAAVRLQDMAESNWDDEGDALPRESDEDRAAREADEEAQAKAEYEAERATERFYEEGTAAQHEQYCWEVEQDERRAAAFGF